MENKQTRYNNNNAITQKQINSKQKQQATNKMGKKTNLTKTKQKKLTNKNNSK